MCCRHPSTSSHLHEGDVVRAIGAEGRLMTVDLLSEGLELVACHWLEAGGRHAGTFRLGDLRLVEHGHGPAGANAAPSA